MNRDSYLALRSEFLESFPQAKAHNMNLMVWMPSGEIRHNQFTGKDYDVIVGFDWCENLGVSLNGGFERWAISNPDGTVDQSGSIDALFSEWQQDEQVPLGALYIKYAIHKAKKPPPG